MHGTQQYMILLVIKVFMAMINTKFQIPHFLWGRVKGEGFRGNINCINVLFLKNYLSLTNMAIW